MKIGPCCLSTILMLIAFNTGSPNLNADVIWVKDNATAHYGKIVEQTETDTTLQIWTSDNGNTNQTTRFKNREIIQAVKTVTENQLASLDPARPHEFRDLAEEIGSQANDPYAKSLSRRLYIIAAYHSIELRTPCLTALKRLSSSQAERKKIEMLLVAASQTKGETPTKSLRATPRFTEPELQKLLDVTQAIRRNQNSVAKSLLIPSLNDRLDEWYEPNQRIALQNAIETGKTESLAEILRFEIRLRELLRGKDVSSKQKNDSGNWQQLSRQVEPPIMSIPTIENLTEFDPAKAIYRDGHWTEPESE